MVNKCLPAPVFTPVANAVAVPAESGTWASVLYVLDSAVYGNFSQLKTFSSPLSPLLWPSYILAVVVVLIPMPSPKIEIKPVNLLCLMSHSKSLKSNHPVQSFT